jgi:hypothetical protein
MLLRCGPFYRVSVIPIVRLDDVAKGTCIVHVFKQPRFQRPLLVPCVFAPWPSLLPPRTLSIQLLQRQGRKSSQNMVRRRLLHRLLAAHLRLAMALTALEVRC